MKDKNETESQLQALQSLVVGNRELEQLEALARRFNIFEALGVVRAERRHSDFLGFLLSPKEAHGLGDRFLKRFLQTALNNEPSVASITPIDVDLMDLTDAEISVERGNIDVLIRDVQSRICVIVENKIDSTQHSDQLARYYRLETTRHRDETVFGIYLTVDGEPPGNEHYAPLTHADIRKQLETLVATPGLRIESDVQFALNQYSEVLGRHFMADERIGTLCEKIYSQHKQAIDLIISHISNQREAVTTKLTELIENESDLILDDCSKAYIRFITKDLNLPQFKCGSGWTGSSRIFLFEFQIRDRVTLVIQMGPGNPTMRKQMFEFALSRPSIFKMEKKYYEQWQTLFRKPIVEKLDGSIPREQLIKMIEAKWQEFITEDLPRIEGAILENAWPTLN